MGDSLRHDSGRPSRGPAETRRETVERLVARLPLPWRLRLENAAAAVFRHGRLDAVAAVTGRPSPAAVRRVAILVALAVAELRLAGSVRVSTPRVDDDRWGAFGCRAFPSGAAGILWLERERGALVLRCVPARGSELTALREAVSVVAREVAVHLGEGVAVRQPVRG